MFTEIILKLYEPEERGEMKTGEEDGEEEKSPLQFNASPVLSPNQRRQHPPLNSSNYLKDNQWLFTCQS